MNNSKKAAVLLAAIMMVFALALPVRAEGQGDGSITLQAVSGGDLSQFGTEFRAYQIFQLRKIGDTGYVYTIHEDFEDFVFYHIPDPQLPGIETYQGDALRVFLSNLDTVSGISAPEGTAVNYIDSTAITIELTEQIEMYINSVNGGMEVIIEPAGTAAATGTVATIDHLNPGYYIVLTDQAHTYYQQIATPIFTMLTVEDNQRAVTLKGERPTIDKKVFNEDTGTWESVADINIGDTVQFKLITAVPYTQGYQSGYFNVYDCMSPGLEFVFDEYSIEDSFEIYIDNVLYQGEYSVYDYGVISSPDFLIDGKPVLAVEIGFKLHDLEAYPAGAPMEIYYTARVTKDIAKENGAAYNKTYICYTSDPYMHKEDKTPDAYVSVYTFSFELVKLNSAAERLNGAKFTLSRNREGIPEYALFDNEGILSGWTDDVTAAEFEVIDGSFMLYGLDAGIYHLTETQAPMGYNMPEHPIEIVILPEYHDQTGFSAPILSALTITYDGEIAVDTMATGQYDGIYEVAIVNNAGVLFPETGGMGTASLTITGMALMIGTGLILIIKRKALGANR